VVIWSPTQIKATVECVECLVGELGGGESIPLPIGPYTEILKRRLTIEREE